MSILGCLGLVLWGHHIAPAALAFTGYAWAFYALILALRKPILAGVVLGVSLLVLLLGATWADAALVMVIAAGLLGFAAWRRSCYLVALVTALVIALPLAALWGYALNEYSPAMFQLWWQQYAWGPYGGAAAIQWLHEPGFLPATLVWFAWPVLPLAAWSLWINRNELKSDFAWQPLLWFLVAITAYIVISGQPTEVIVLPLLIVLGLIAVAGVDDLRRGAASALNSFSVLTFGLTAIGIWVVWGILMWGGQSQLFLRLSRHSSSLMQFSPLGFGFALIVTVLWGGILLRPRAIGRKALTNWSCGLILVMGLFVGLFQDWVDSGKSYRPVGVQLHSAASQIQAHCIDAQGIPSAPLGAMVYFSDYPIKTMNPDECEVAIRLRQDPPRSGWTVIGEANRSGESKEKFLIYAK
ncbi:hypothetical protein HQ393_07575 [Chitinibacter bivalviorum]|uniref:Glycosyltransferase family 39 protein n=1 Tax=Chitinibacter bivalviorum TaxID=2739434 RepID=A0A7H9BHM9_9NEIS|nr:hypothetical protein [Chitinibacter bivalviorum]QLG88125.1 hypothetical protein HQ393_07575 [Chitinibacter bivalviorum]